MVPPPSSPSESVDRVAEDLLDEERRSDYHHHTFVFPAAKILYVESPKAAATSILNALAPLTGEGTVGPPPVTEGDDRARFGGNRWVHTRANYDTPSLAEVDPRTLDEALTSDEWLRFCVTRHPLKRLFSAWETKILVGDLPVFERLPLIPLDFRDDRVDVQASFARFVDAMFQDPALFFIDMHFRPQVEVVHRSSIRYTHVVDISALAEFYQSLSGHVFRWTGRYLPELGVMNQSRITVDWRRSYSAKSAVQVEQLFVADLAAFGYEMPTPGPSEGEILDATTSYLVAIRRAELARQASLAAELTRLAVETEAVRREAIRQVRSLRAAVTAQRAEIRLLESLAQDRATGTDRVHTGRYEPGYTR